jgi:hypothetical protein
LQERLSAIAVGTQCAQNPTPKQPQDENGFRGMSDLEVSVVIPTYNRGALLPRAVASALANIRPGDEVIAPGSVLCL